MIQLENTDATHETCQRNVVNKLIKARILLCKNMERVRIGFCNVVVKTNGSSRGRCQSGGHRQVCAEAYEADRRARAVLGRRDS